MKRWAFSNANRKAFLSGPKRVYDKRSDQQNRTVMGLYMDQILEELGYEPEDKLYIYGLLKIESGYFEERVNTKTGEVVKVPKKTRDFDTAKYTKFMDDFVRNATKRHNIVLPDPVAELARI
ncbi:MAG: hypothetical protein ACREH5_09070 [Candidatus Omnitrophota bacterium]